MMIPITRKEKYINEIVGGGNTAPETPQTREELFFAGILGEVVAPSPITRAEKYLAKIANKYSGELPEPVTRIERFLARAAGMDATIPTPITREEMFWADYALIVEKELSGIPPLTFNAIAGTLKNYRIYGNTVNGENVGDLITEGEHAGEYSVPVTVSNGTDALTTPIYLPEQIRKVGDEAEYIDYGEQKQHRVRKNLLPITVKTQTISGVTFTVNNDGGVTCNGTATATIAKHLLAKPYIFNNVILTGCPIGGGRDTFQLDIIQASSPYKVLFQDIGDGVRVDTGNDEVSCRIRIVSGYTCDNLTFYPMIRKADITDDTYEPYIENTEVDVTLPEIAVTAGTNTLTAGAAVQPSDVYIKYEGAR